ncbi:MAG TPA: transcription-repair coupling factor [Terriglobales bacterium]|nr:transcription-repair coupling factor [Terriglobales bacterium]
MVLPFVRDLFADVEHLPAFARAASLLKTGVPTTSGSGVMGSKTGAEGICVSGLTPTAKALLIALLHRVAGKLLVVLVPGNRTAEDLQPVIAAFGELTGAIATERGTASDSVLVLPGPDVLPFEGLSPHPEIQEERAATLAKMASGAASVVIVPVASAAMRVRAPEFYSEMARTIRRGETLDAEPLLQHLNTLGYVGSDVVEMPGEYALRGGILDVYPPEADRPLRIELFGDEVESIRKFDPGTQRSTTSVEEVVLLPLTDVPVREDTLAAVHARLSGKRVSGENEAVEAAVRAGGVGVFPGWEFYAGVAGAQHTVFDLFSRVAVIVDEPQDTFAELDHWWERVREMHQRSGIGNLVRPEELYLTAEELASKLNTLPRVDFQHLGLGSGDIEHDGQQTDIEIEPAIDHRPPTVDLLSQPTTRFHGSVPAMVDEVKKLSAAGKRVLFAAASSGEVERIADLFSEYGVTFRLGSRTPRPGESYLDDAAYLGGLESTTTVVKAAIPDGVALPDANLIVFGTRDLFEEPETVVIRPQRSKSKTGAFISDFRDLTVGDYVVHVEHGIAQYHGLKEIPQADGEKAEFMILEYAEAARLYVPLTRLDLVQKYRSAEGGAKPVLNRLGTQQWAKTKARVKKAMKDMADELLKLYALRKTAEGHAFPADTQWQHEFEDAFEFNETDDQANAILDVKKDMEQTQPMDRLLCGDVGYGKTEVAMRAAFKAVSDNKQVAVLAPTTVLAFQHFETFKRRFAAFPITVEMISRFRTARQQKEIIEKVEQGKVDVLIGTHRLLSKDIKFADLGLVVVDEEQRFGVRHKERLKQLKKEVDVLTMSATPIPRTLHMSLVGLRDMSVIETPPKDRIAIETVVAGWDEKIVKSSIERELERGGQAYLVHNRVDTIYEIAARVQELVPRARVIVGHGQMTEGELEKVMLAFMRHEADVLVATTIIENGLDIPLCNTIIVNRADRHGLSELYQLRGRVGRSNRRAYAYLLIPPDTELTPIARRRLAALKEFSDLGAGFKIAALDLELRGAGNLLGGEQSGHIDAVGFELYTSMLERTVREIKGEAAPDEAETQLNLGLNIRISSEYIPQENQRLRMYKRVAGVETESQLGDVRGELEDRYGPPPAAVRNLLEYAALKILAQRVGVAGIERKRDLVSIRFTEHAAINPERLAHFVATQKGAQFTPAGVLRFLVKNTAAEEVLTRLKQLLQDLSAGQVAQPGPQLAASD